VVKHDALVVIDVQNDFMPGGSLAVSGADRIVPLVNGLALEFDSVVITQDWHPSNHISFASRHSGKKPFDSIELPYGRQVLWPVHCVQGTRGAALHPELHIPRAQLILRKGFHADIDSYSAFLEADRKTPTGLSGYLANRGITRLFLAGLATDFCVAWSALDARQCGFDVAVVEDATRAIDVSDSLTAAWRAMKQAGVGRVQAAEIVSR